MILKSNSILTQSTGIIIISKCFQFKMAKKLSWISLKHWRFLISLLPFKKGMRYEWRKEILPFSNFSFLHEYLRKNNIDVYKYLSQNIWCTKNFEAFQKKCAFMCSSNIPTYAKSWWINLMSGIVACTYAVSFSPRKKV